MQSGKPALLGGFDTGIGLGAEVVEEFLPRAFGHLVAKQHAHPVEGLPQAGERWVMGEFGTAGQVPVLEDERVQFFKGWFQDVLPKYSVPPHDVLVMNLDADLYSSTIYVLKHMRPHIRKGTFVYFDEIHYAEHEQQAFDEFVGESKLKFRCVAADKSLAHVFFECLG